MQVGPPRPGWLVDQPQPDWMVGLPRPDWMVDPPEPGWLVWSHRPGWSNGRQPCWVLMLEVVGCLPSCCSREQQQPVELSADRCWSESLVGLLAVAVVAAVYLGG